ncbi:MAG: hypothetical protein KatS3mg039_0991 [Candidatus Kapaibacterium sp.]|nr:MAG: hypothetical protein KatS3mg039_0991 [Candidatus Kapabacteria bacterium]
MMKYVLITATILMAGCIGREEASYPIKLSVTVQSTHGRLQVPMLADSEKLVGYDPIGGAVVEQRAGRERVSFASSDTILDARPTRNGYVLALREGDSIRFVRLHGNGALLLGTIPATTGRFVPTVADVQLAWQSNTQFFLLTPGRGYSRGNVVVREGATVVLDGDVLVVLDRIEPQLLLWEGTELSTGRKLFSCVVAGRIEQAIATAEKAIGLIRHDSAYALEWYGRNLRGDAVAERTVVLPPAYYEPRLLVSVSDTIAALFASGVALVTSDGVVGEYRSRLGELPDTILVAFRRDGAIFLSGLLSVVRIELSNNSWWWVDRAIPIAVRIVLAVIGVAVFVIVASRIGRYRRLVGALLNRGSGGALLVVDRHSRLRRLNTAARAMFGINHSVPLRRPIEEYLSGRRWIRLREIIEQSVRHRQPMVEEIALPTNGEQRFIVSAEPLLTLLNHFEGVLVSLVDVTAQYQQWRLLNWAQIAHDMQTHLTTIRLTAEQLAGSLPPDREQQRVRILRQTSILLDRVRDVLALGRGDQMQWEECSLAELLEDVVGEIAAMVPAQISFDVRPTPLVVRLDRRRIARALHNALTNAIRAIEPASGTVKVWAELERGGIVIAVEDTGHGMDPETRARFLQPLYTTNPKGHGFGSMIMQRMIELHGGRIEVRSEPGKGTTILFHLPGTLYVRHQR